MTQRSIRILAAVYFVLLWSVFTWPLAMFVFTGIPSSATNVEKGNVIRMVPGDHLQLHYNFWLVKDMLSGGTPLFHNIYEFNTGSDEARFAPRPYYAPASLVYALTARFGGAAFGWNISGLLCMLVGFWASWRLARRFVDDEATALMMGSIGQLLPFCWVSLLSGSPAGFGFVWVAVLFLGVDIAIRDRRAAGGFLAGLAILFAAWTDSHVFFFLALATPCWCLLSFMLCGSVDMRARVNWREWVVALLPLVVLAAIACMLFDFEHSDMLGGTPMEGERSDAEVRLFSPESAGLLTFSHARGAAHIYLGYGLAAILGLGFVSLMLRPPAMSCPPGRVRLFVAALFLGISGVAVLSLGVSGPRLGKAFVLARDLIPPYVMIRQPSEIFCLMPALISIAASISMASLLTWLRPIHYRRAGLIVIALLLSFTLKRPVDATICLLDNGNGAYRDVANDAARRDVDPHALAIPLWPGDSAWSSLNTHYASLYRIRMVNGYSPFVRSNYVEDVFLEYDSINKGALDEHQIASLLKMGVGYIILHENAFPEKVSPYPVAFTLQRFLNHAYLDLLHQSGDVWAFRLLDRPRQVKSSVSHWFVFGPSCRWDLSRTPHEGVVVKEEPSAWHGRSVHMSHTNAWLETAHAPRAVSAPGQRWLLRARGAGTFRAMSLARNPLEGTTKVLALTTASVDSPEWRWAGLPIDVDPDNHELSLRLEHLTGDIELDMLMLAAGDWTAPMPNHSLSIPAACFFRAGYTDIRNGCVVLRPDREPDRAMFYGPRMPLDVGRHRMELVFTSTAPAMTRLGRIDIYVGEQQVGACEVMAGRPAQVAFPVEYNLPLEIRFVYSRNSQICLHRVILLHEDAPTAR